MPQQGLIISFIGLDGSGKSTYIKYTERWLSENTNRNIIVAGSMKPSQFHVQLKKSAELINNNISDIYTAEFIGISHAIDLIYNLEETILPAINKGYIVITDRYDLCALAYSRAIGSKSKTIDKILSLCLEPKLFFYLDVSVETALKRIKERSVKDGVPISPKENYHLLSKAHHNYKSIIDNDNRNIVVINAENDMEQVYRAIKIELQNLIKREGLQCVGC